MEETFESYIKYTWINLHNKFTETDVTVIVQLGIYEKNSNISYNVIRMYIQLWNMVI